MVTVWRTNLTACICKGTSSSNIDLLNKPHMEAILAGVPVLVSRECEITKALQTVDGGTDVVIPSSSPEEWANRIQELSQRSPDERYASAVRLRENYGKRYHWKEESEKFMKMILQLAPSPTPKETVITGLLWYQ